MLLGFLGPLEHPGDQVDVHRLRLERLLASGLDPLRPPFLHQAEQPVGLAHLRPGQRAAQEGLQVLAYGLAVLAPERHQLVDVAHGVSGALAGQVGGVGRAPSGAWRGWTFISSPLK